MPATATDDFNGSPSALLSARSGWSRLLGTDAVQLSTTGFTLRMTNGTTTAATTWHVLAPQPSTADQYATCNLLNYSDATTSAFPLGVRCDTSATTGAGYFLRRAAGGSASPNQLQLFKRSNSGAFTSLGSYTPANTGDLGSPVTLKAVGDQITVELLGVAVIGPVSDASVTSGSVAMLTRGGTLYGGNQADNYEIGDVGGAAIAGTASGSIGLTGAGAGGVAVRGATAGALALSGASAAAVRVAGAASGSIALTGAAAVGVVPPIIGTVAGSLPLTGAGAGAVRIGGTGAGAMPLTGIAAGSIAIIASCAGSLALTGSCSATVGAVPDVTLNPARRFLANSRIRSFAAKLRQRQFEAQP